MSETTKKKRKGYGAFTLAAIAYMVGVIAFSIWSYFQQRTSLIEQIDQSLVNATHATEQILGHVFLACAVETETPQELGYAASQDNLNRFANDCHYEILGAIGHKGGKTWELIHSDGQNGILATDTPRFHDLFHSKLFSIGQPLASAGNDSILIQTVEFEKYGELRIAIRYRPISADSGYSILVARSTRNLNQLTRALAIRIVAIGVFLFAMAFPLIVLYNRIQIKSAQKTDELNAQLQQDFIELKEREAELEDAIHDLERFNNVAVGRENRIIELKAEVNTLLEQMNRQKRYNIDHVNPPVSKPKDG